MIFCNDSAVIACRIICSFIISGVLLHAVWVTWSAALCSEHGFSRYIGSNLFLCSGLLVDVWIQIGATFRHQHKYQSCVPSGSLHSVWWSYPQCEVVLSSSQLRSLSIAFSPFLSGLENDFVGGVGRTWAVYYIAVDVLVITKMMSTATACLAVNFPLFENIHIKIIFQVLYTRYNSTLLILPLFW
jgi:hypothetical protein